MCDETKAILSDPELMRAIAAGEKDVREGRVHDHEDVVAKLSAECAEETA